MRNQRGFTLIELMIVITIIAVIAAIAIPNLLTARLNANETAAIGTMRNIISAQSQFQTTSKADVNSNGTGEFGYFGEMSGGVGVRGGVVLAQPVLSTAFRAVVGDGIVVRNGYNFIIGLPDAGGAPVLENTAGTPDPDLAETTWCCYAWPTSYGTTGLRTFFVNQGGDIICTEDSSYSGSAAVPMAGGSAFAAGGPAGTITGRVATGLTGRDGNFWKQVG